MPEQNNNSQTPAEHETFESRGSLTVSGRKQTYQTTAGWLPLYKDDQESARVFHTYYRLGRRDPGKRPLTFVFNGGPGAASAYLHIGAIGPIRVATPADGSLPDSPVTLVGNAESWLPFTDLVFVDPVGTGLSRTVKEPADGEDKKPAAADDTFYWDVDQDLNALCEFIASFLSREDRWRSPLLGL